MWEVRIGFYVGPIDKSYKKNLVWNVTLGFHVGLVDKSHELIIPGK